MQKKIRGGVVGLLLLGSATLTQAQRLEATDVGQILENQGASQFIVDAGNAIRATCLELGAAGPQTAERQDLFNRCREMSGTVLGLTGTTPPNGYGYSSPDDVFDAIRQFSGEEVSSQTRLATESTNRQFTNLGVRMDAIRRGARSTLSPVAFNFNGMDLAEGLAANAGAPAGGTGASADRDADTGWAWFGNAAIGWGDRDQTSNESGYDFDSYGLTLGADYAFDNGLALGLALGYASYDVDLDRDPAGALVSSSAGGKIESDGYSLSGFFVYGLEDYYLNGILSYGRNDFDLVRLTSIAAAPEATGTGAGLTLDRRFDGSTDSSQLGGQLTGGRIFGSGATTLDLYAGMDYLDIDIDGFEEREANASGGLALRYSDQDTQSVQSIVGVMLRHATSTGFGVLQPYAGVEWRHEFDNESQALEYSYAFAQPGSTISFRTPTDDPDENFFELTLGLSAQFANGLFGFVQYNSTVGLSDTSANVVTLGLRGVF
ncbi:autotransporter outer membrane beta-barrel domain-containing protein [Kineobactrum salinum]|uniref:Autotransporter outer membrane beta-barrel domain-containing protein n=1 Tax=Kineobactrum salinum TaxID=2708301 RepID=A0A6C0U185_9GAMM|nr:autotransporter outer membrane beta-barrel domain-containing protein [Kineobactrum salinum]QIB65882.1 autotransporter outer membrane beta-barrel domain-containing protein [Kineobactrum salinum]